MPRGEPWRFIAIDESNHGRFPEVIVAAYSNIDSDAAIYPNPMFEKHRDHGRLSARLTKRGYAFVLLTKEMKELASDSVIYGSVIYSLVDEIERTNPCDLYLDGEIHYKKINEVHKQLKYRSNMPQSKVRIHIGKDLDKRVLLVNVADELAHWLYRKPLEEIANHDHLCKLRLP